MGLDFQVVTTEPVSDKTSVWMDDLRAFQDRIHKVDSGFPKVVRTGPQSFFDKLKYRAALADLRKKSAANHYDHSVMWKSQLMNKLKELIEMGYANVIATAGPFSYLAEVARLKDEFPHLNLIADFRDPWTNNRTSFGFDVLDSARLKEEQRLEKRVINAFDHVVSVSDQMNVHFKKLLTSDTAFHEITNGFDQDEMKPASHSRVNARLTLVFVGTLYKKVEPSFDAFAQAVASLPEESQAKLSVEIYGQSSAEMINKCKSLEATIRFNGSVSLSEAQMAITEADVGLLFLTSELKYSLSTKFFEYLGNDLPIWVVAEPGKTSELIVSKQLGWHSIPNHAEIKQGLMELLELWESGHLKKTQSTEKDMFSTKSLAVKYASLLTS